MGDASEAVTMSAAHRTIASAEHEKALNTIDGIRSQGIARYLDIPQIIVCGDQSSGKSSCLEAISGLRFPTGDTLCTVFPTEYVLRRSNEVKITITITPDTERPELEKATIADWKPSTNDLNDFPSIILEAKKAMGIDDKDKTFSHDALRIEITGPTQDHLTLVDLPGLFHSASTTHSDDDKESVFSLVRSYIKRSRSIILAVVSAKNDVNNQAVLNFAREHDKQRSRTLGIITKPDTLPIGSPSEQAYIKLAQNKDVEFALGWHVLRNRSFEERNTTAAERDLTEKEFFSQGIWNSLGQKSKGVFAMRNRLSKILHDHILTELPDLLEDVERGLNDCNSKLETLGDSRGTIDEQKAYLLKASSRFVALMSAAVHANYTDRFFGTSQSDVGYQKRLCAITNNTLKKFAKEMLKNGKAVDLVDEVPHGYIHKPGTPKKVSKDAFYAQVEQRMSRNGGKELPGLYNPTIVSDLFFDQAKPWWSLVDKAKGTLIDAAQSCVLAVLEASADEATVHGILREIVNPEMEKLEAALSAKAEEVLAPHGGGEVLTFNHYFTDNIQAKRKEKSRRDMGKRVQEFLGKDPLAKNPADRRYQGNGFDVGHLLDVLVKQNEPNMDRFAAIDCVDAMESYYQVTIKSVIDNFGIYAVKTCFLNKLPDMFSPSRVIKLDAKTVQLIAGESDESLIEREDLTKKRAVLLEAKKVLLRLDRHKSRDVLASRKPRGRDEEEEENESEDSGSDSEGN